MIAFSLSPERAEVYRAAGNEVQLLDETATADGFRAREGPLVYSDVDATGKPLRAERGFNLVVHARWKDVLSSSEFPDPLNLTKLAGDSDISFLVRQC